MSAWWWWKRRESAGCGSSTGVGGSIGPSMMSRCCPDSSGVSSGGI